MNIKLVKLVSGEEFLSEITADSKEYLFCKNMVKFAMTPDGVAMIPFNPLIPKDDVIQLNQEHITFTTEVLEEFLNVYKQQFGGVLLPKKGLLLT
jgi:hypothetical protein